MTCYLLDTNIISALISEPDGPAARRAMSAEHDDLVTSVVVACEVAFGLKRRPGKRSDALQAQWTALCGTLPVLGLDEQAVEHYAALRVSLEAAGTPIGYNDMLIAAHALSLEAVVVTGNVREFSRVQGLKVENWLNIDEATSP